MKTKLLISTAIVSVMLVSTGCKKYLDVNTNPNVAQDVPPEMLLSSAQVYLASNLGVDMNINGAFWAQYWTQGPSASQYRTLDQYQPNANNYDNAWIGLYSSALEDLDQMELKATAANKKEYTAVSKIMKAYIFQLATDAWGDIPFTEALKGLKTGGSGGTVSPHFDAQETVYNGIFKLLDEAKTQINDLQTSELSGDLIYGGDMLLWYKFANTIELKAYLRISYKDKAKAQAGIENLYQDPVGFIDQGESAQISFASQAGNQNPLYSEIAGLGFVTNIVASSTVIDSMNANGDPRALVYFTQNIGSQQGDYNTSATSIGTPTAITGADPQDDASATAAVKFLSSYESYFLQAEAVARGLDGGASANSAEDLFDEGITLSFEESGLSDQDASDYMAGSYWGMFPTSAAPDMPDLTETQVRHIITQKWFSMTGTQGFEAWTEWRRTGYPQFFRISVNSLIGNNLPVRFLYPNVELTENANFPGQKLVTERVWWDVN